MRRQAATGVEIAIPVLMKLYDRAVVLKKELEPHRVDLLLPSIFGLIMCFFGGIVLLYDL
jgi:hypothetical protein